MNNMRKTGAGIALTGSLLLAGGALAVLTRLVGDTVDR